MQATTLSPNKNTALPTNDINSGSIRFNHSVSVEDELSANFELIKILKRHQGERRWILLIAPACLPSKALLSCCDVDQFGVLVVHHRQINDGFATIKNALTNATCEAVVAWNNALNEDEAKEIDALTQKSRSHFYAFDATPVLTNSDIMPH